MSMVDDLLDTAISLSRLAWEEGILSLYSYVDSHSPEDDLFTRGLQLFADGTSFEVINQILNKEAKSDLDHFKIALVNMIIWYPIARYEMRKQRCMIYI